MSESGILYIIYGNRSLEEARVSIQSAQKQMPGILISIIADEKLRNFFNIEVDQINFVNMPETWNWNIKVKHIAKLPYQKTIFIDTDTVICDDITDLFDLLDRVDIAMAHEPVRTWGFELDGIPDSFPMLNTGVIAFKKSEKTANLFSKWTEAHKWLDSEKVKNPKISYTDQNSFRYALYNSKEIDFSILPPEYNCRVGAGCVAGKVKILHAHFNLKKIEKLINASNHIRLHGTIREKLFFIIERSYIKIILLSK